MKTLQLLCLAMLFSLTANSQITKGNFMVGGSGSFYASELKDENANMKSKGLELRPSIGYFLVDKFALGLSPLLAYNKPENGNAVTSYGIGPFARCYLLNPEKKVNVLTHAGYSYFKSSNSDSKSSAFDFRAGPVIYFNSSVAFEMTINYNINKIDSTTYTILSLGLGFQIHLEK